MGDLLIDPLLILVQLTLSSKGGKGVRTLLRKGRKSITRVNGIVF